ncbi:MAG: hypothetical protein IPI11_05990 [Haliscomenobacter sp.]|nr:hypothetical protein [Haliscomenobacter sp.]
MTVDQLRKINLQITTSKKAFSGKTIEEVAKELRHLEQVDSLFLHEVNIFVNRVHKVLSKTDYYDQIESDLDEVCNLALHLSEYLKMAKKKDKPLPLSMIAQIRKMGKILAKIAPFIRLVSGVIILLNNSDVKFG